MCVRTFLISAPTETFVRPFGNIKQLSASLPSTFLISYSQILGFVDRASRYNHVKKNQLDARLFLVYFVNLYMFRAYLGPSSGGTTVCIQHLVLIILSVVLVGLVPIQTGQQTVI
jgi:hypothetical protein